MTPVRNQDIVDATKRRTFQILCSNVLVRVIIRVIINIFKMLKSLLNNIAKQDLSKLQHIIFFFFLARMVLKIPVSQHH